MSQAFFSRKNLYTNHAKLKSNINNHTLCFWTIFLGSSRLLWTWQISRTKRSLAYFILRTIILQNSNCLAFLHVLLYSLWLNQFHNIYFFLSGTFHHIRSSTEKKRKNLQLVYICFPNEVMTSSSPAYFPKVSKLHLTAFNRTLCLVIFACSLEDFVKYILYMFIIQNFWHAAISIFFFLQDYTLVILTHFSQFHLEW